MPPRLWTVRVVHAWRRLREPSDESELWESPATPSKPASNPQLRIPERATKRDHTTCYRRDGSQKDPNLPRRDQQSALREGGRFVQLIPPGERRSPHQYCCESDSNQPELHVRDSHVVSVRYRLVPSESVEFDNPPAVERSLEAFDVRLADGVATFTMNQHHATESSARRQTDPYVRGWEIDTALRWGQAEVAFKCDRTECIDRNPPKSESGKTIHELSGRVVLGVHASASLSVTRRTYPNPPDNFSVSPDVEALWNRYEGYLDGRESLLAMAYFCLTVVEFSTGAQRNQRRVAAAQMYGFSDEILKTMGEITSTHGDERTARKAGNNRPLTDAEREWVKATIKVIVRRIGQYDADPAQARTQITMSDLPPLS